MLPLDGGSARGIEGRALTANVANWANFVLWLWVG